AIAVSDSSGRAVRSLTGPGEAGFHRVVWDLTAGDPKLRIRRSELSGQPPLVRAGRYRIQVRARRAAPRSRAPAVRASPGTYLSEMRAPPRNALRGAALRAARAPALRVVLEPRAGVNIRLTSGPGRPHPHARRSRVQDSLNAAFQPQVPRDLGYFRWRGA